MIRECNENEILSVQNNISFLRFLKNNLNEIKQLYPNGTIDFHKQVDDIEYSILYKNGNSDIELLNLFLKCNVNSVEHIYEELYFDNLNLKYNDYNDKYPHLTDSVYFEVDYEMFESGEMAESGYFIYETILYSKMIDKFLNLFINDDDKMYFINYTLSKLRNCFCASLGLNYVGNCFCIVKNKDYYASDYISSEYLDICEYTICYLTLIDQDRSASPIEILYYAQELKEMFDYMEKEVYEYERNNN